jgi:hypothetical protein
MACADYQAGEGSSPSEAASRLTLKFFVSMLQRVGQHPASLVQQLTPRIWKEMFAENPLRSDLHDLGGRRTYTAA